MVSAVRWVSLVATAWPEGRWRLLMSRRGAVHWWGPHGGGGWARGRSEVTFNSEAHGGCDCGGSEAH
jgi:hypothetical protein